MLDNEFADKILELLVSENGYICDCGHRYDVQQIAFNELSARIKRHPIIWKMFFQLA